MALEGRSLAEHLPALARLRIEVFSAFPYLYDGSLDYETRYLERYAATPGAVIVGAFAGARLVGAATALPMTAEPPNITEPLARAGLAIRDLFYFGESVLEPAYRGRGIGVAFFQERESHALRQGFNEAVFSAVARADDDPRRPAGYVPLDGFWQRRGYRKLEGVTCTLSWKEIGEASESPKTLQFWARRLA